MAQSFTFIHIFPSFLLPPVNLQSYVWVIAFDLQYANDKDMAMTLVIVHFFPLKSGNIYSITIAFDESDNDIENNDTGFLSSRKYDEEQPEPEFGSGKSEGWKLEDEEGCEFTNLPLLQGLEIVTNEMLRNDIVHDSRLIIKDVLFDSIREVSFCWFSNRQKKTRVNCTDWLQNPLISL
ncbi:hypothetical protein LXL04_001307 [Taraxacum kok-saghyz]